MYRLRDGLEQAGRVVKLRLAAGNARASEGAHDVAALIAAAANEPDMFGGVAAE